MFKQIPNPWRNIPRSAPFVLKCDRHTIEAFNSRNGLAESDQLNLKLLPIPFLGRADAPVVLLNLNPGYDTNDDTLQATPYFKKACRNCLEHKASKFPFFFLDPKIEGDVEGPGHRWWRKKLGSLIEYDRQLLAQIFLCVEFFPYRSRRFKPLRETLPSQNYGFQLVREAIKRGSVIVVMRAKRQWFSAVPELEDYKHLVITRNPRNPAISEGNLPDGAFRKIVAAIKSQK